VRKNRSTVDNLDTITGRLAGLEAEARKLDPSPDQRQRMTAQVQAYAERFLDDLPDKQTYVPDDGRDGFAGDPPREGPSDMSDLLEVFEREVDTTGILPASGGQLGYIPGAGLYPSALGDFLAAISNRYSGVSFAGPGAARMEHSLVRWMCSLVDYPRQAAGDLTSGGSTATLSALVAARDAGGIDAGAVREACVYLTPQVHHCIVSALHVAGLGSTLQRLVPMDDRFRMDTAALQRRIEEDRRQGLNPWLVVGSAGTTDTGAVDPIPEIADIAAREGLWFHLDAAYGGFFVLCEEAGEQLGAMGRADSIVMDPHKGLGIPYGTGAVLVRDGAKLAASNSYYADYMQDAKAAASPTDAAFSPSDYSLELTRHFRGPRMWLPLKLFGLAPFRASLAEKIWLARYFHQKIATLDGFEAGPEPDLSIVTFRYRPHAKDSDAINRRLLEAVHRDGRVFITSTLVDGAFTLRLAVLNFRTHRDRIDYLLELLQREAAKL
jgi:glutamate/tyrosine decarboxylase-like PLP-dependent enzyme